MNRRASRCSVTIGKVPGALSISAKKRTRSILLPSILRSSLISVSFTPAVPAIILMKMGLVSVVGDSLRDALDPRTA